MSAAKAEPADAARATAPIRTFFIVDFPVSSLTTLFKQRGLNWVASRQRSSLSVTASQQSPFVPIGTRQFLASHITFCARQLVGWVNRRFNGSLKCDRSRVW